MYHILATKQLLGLKLLMDPIDFISKSRVQGLGFRVQGVGFRGPNMYQRQYSVSLITVAGYINQIST